MIAFSRSVLLILFVFFCGCASDNHWQAEEVPLPRATPYDSNEFARTAYLDGFRRGYRAGDSAGVEMLAGPNVQARRQGFQAGAAHARAEKSGAARGNQ